MNEVFFFPRGKEEKVFMEEERIKRDHSDF